MVRDQLGPLIVEKNPVHLEGVVRLRLRIRTVLLFFGWVEILSLE